jgi:PucR family transcriptional regulator, purine catabolism regulatory protein
LRTLLERDRNVTATARALGIHRSTVLHRIARVEALTGRNPAKVQDVAELWLTTSAHAILDDSQHAPRQVRIGLGRGQP